MRNLKARRSGAHEVKKGKFKGCLHVAGKSFKKFSVELNCLHTYLESRLLPTEPEERRMRGIILVLANVLEHESEELIRYYVRHHPTEHYEKFVRKMDDGYVSFKSKFEWLRKRSLIDNEEQDIMEEIRVLRNAHAHAKPSERRPRHKYFGRSLLTTTSLRRIFVDVESVLQRLREQSGRKAKWGTAPPGYASETKWSKKAIAVLDKR